MPPSAHPSILICPSCRTPFTTPASSKRLLPFRPGIAMSCRVALICSNRIFPGRLSYGGIVQLHDTVLDSDTADTHPRGGRGARESFRLALADCPGHQSREGQELPLLGPECRKIGFDDSDGADPILPGEKATQAGDDSHTFRLERIGRGPPARSLDS